MNKALKNVLKNSALYTVCTITCKAIGFILLPIYTTFLTGEEYGIANTVIAFTSTFDIVVMLALREALIRFYSSYSNEERRGFVGTVVVTVVSNGCFVALLLIATHNIWNDWFLSGVDFYPIVLCGILTLVFETVYITYQSVLQSRQDGRGYLINGVFYGVLQAVMNVIFIAFFRFGVLGVVLGAMCSNAVFALYGIVRMLKKRYMTFTFSKKMCVSSLKYSVPFIPYNLSLPIANFISKVLLNRNASYAATGLYTVSSQISSIMSLVQQSLNLAFRPWFNEQMNTGIIGRKNIREFSGLMFSLNSFVCIMVALFSQEAILLFTSQEYHAAWRVVPILVMALEIEFVYYIHALTIMYDMKASKFIAICSITGSLSNVLLASYLIPAISSYGAAAATLIAKIIMSIVTVCYSRKVNKVDFNMPKMIRQIFFTTLIICLGLLYPLIMKIEGFDLINIACKILLLAVSALLLLFPCKKLLMDFVRDLIHKENINEETSGKEPER